VVTHLVMAFLFDIGAGSLFIMLRDIELVTLLKKLTADHMVYVKSQIGRLNTRHTVYVKPHCRFKWVIYVGAHGHGC
jgi:hypothetical protein